MNRTTLALFLLALALPNAGSYAQTITASLSGTILDPSGSAIPGTEVTITNQSTGSVQTARSNETGLFVFSSVLPATYTLQLNVTGFRPLQMRDIALTANERRSLGEIRLDVGQVQERVEVSAEVTPIQTTSSERAGLVSGSQMMNTAIKGRDFVALLATLPGIVDLNYASREISKGTANGGVHINGGRDTAINFALDGVQDEDTGSNSGSHNQPNMDAVAEVKVLTSNYQAEYGRNSGGTINVITKSGTQDFHGSGFWYYRHETLNANNFFSNRTGTAKPPYRINNGGYSIGGPAYVPRKFNPGKDKLFFFFSQEFVRRQNFLATQFVTTPTALERAGDYSQTFDLNGALIKIKDPLTGNAFPDNIIPKSRLNPLGQAILNFFPLPNYVEADPKLRYARNYVSNLSGPFSRRQDLVRVDYNFSPTLRAYFRGIRDDDNETWPYGNWTAGSVNYDLTNTYRPQRGRGAFLSITKIISAASVNEFTTAATTRGQSFNPVDLDKVSRKRMGNIGQWYPQQNELGAIPNISFGGVQNPINPSLGNIPYTNENPVFTFIDSFTKVTGAHTLKFGIYIERQRKDCVGQTNPRGAFAFGRDSNNPFDTNYAFSNALLGYFQSYSEASGRPYALWRYTQVEGYAQDSWKVSRRLTLDFGLRLYNIPGANDQRYTITTFNPSRYDPKTAAVMIQPGRDSKGSRVGVDPRTGNIYPVPYIGLFVPGSGNYAPGMVVGGKDGTPGGLYDVPLVNFGPRFGFAFDPQGNGKTAIRGGFGMLYDRVQGNIYVNTAGQPPVAYTPSLYYGTLDTFLQSQGAVGPQGSVNAPQVGVQTPPSVMSYSLGVQRELGFGTVLDIAYVGTQGRHLLFAYNINPIPMYAHFNPANTDPTTGAPLPDNFLRPYLGMGNVNVYAFGASSNYNSLQVAVNRRMSHGIQYGIAYTHSKSLGIASSDFQGASAYFPFRQRNYGSLNWDFPHVLVINYIWDLPNPGKRWNVKPLGWFLDNWQVSGINMFQTGAPFTPGFSTTDSTDLTGSSEGARINVIGDPTLPKGERTFARNFKTEMFARPAVRDFGNAGIGVLRGPGINNWDISVSKRFPLGAESRYIQFRSEFYNAFNHTQFSSIDSTARFDPTGKQVNANFGAYSAARDPRRIQLSLRIMF